MGKTIGVSCPRGNIKHAECRQCALRPDRPCHLTPDILEEMRSSDRNFPPNTYTPTMLLGCDRQEFLRGDGDRYVSIDDAWPAQRGTMVHRRVESLDAYPGVIGLVREVRFITQIITKHGYMSLAGKPDLVVLKRIEGGVLYCKVVDYKSTSEIGHDMIQASDSHQLQVNMYGFLVEREMTRYLDGTDILLHDWDGTVVVDELEIVYLDMKKPRRFTSLAELQARGKQKTYQDERGKWKRVPGEYETLTLAPIEHIPAADMELWIAGRIEARIESQHSLPPLLPPERARYMCVHCPVREVCQGLAEKDGKENAIA